MSELVYYCGTMDSGKSTLALQTAHNHETRGRNGLIFTNRDRAGEGLISSRLGLQKAAIEVDADLNLHRLTIERMSLGERIDFIICDEIMTAHSCDQNRYSDLLQGTGSRIIGRTPINVDD